MGHASVDRVTITPPVGMYLPGMERTDVSQGLRDDLYATAIAIEAGGVEVVIVSCDVLALHPETVSRVRLAASGTTGIPTGNIMLCATHCHSGPVTYALANSQPMYKAYARQLETQLIELIYRVHIALSPAQLNFDKGCSRIGINRRSTVEDGRTVIRGNPEGPKDPEVGVLRVDTMEGHPLAILINYACHPVVLGNGSNVISADWPGAMRRRIESTTGALSLFVQGACADINPLPGEPSDDEGILESLGGEIADEVLRVWEAITTAGFALVEVSSEKVPLPLLPPSQYEDTLPDFVELAGVAAGLSRQELKRWLDDRVPWKAEIMGGGDQRQALMELQALRFDDIGLVSAAGEIFAQTGMQVKAESPILNTMFAGYTNGLVCYLPPPEEFHRGGYEVEEVYLAYRLPSPPAPEAEGIVKQAALRLLCDLHRD